MGGAPEGLLGRGKFDELRGSGGAPADLGKGGSAGLGVLGTGKGGSESGDGAAASCLATCSSAMVRVSTSGDSARGSFLAWFCSFSWSTESPLKGEASEVSSVKLMSGGLGVVSVCVSSTNASLAGSSSVSAGVPFMASRSGAATSATVGSECTSSPVAVAARFSSDSPGGGVSSPAICVCMLVSTVGKRLFPADGSSAGATSNSPHEGQGSTGRTRLRSAEQFGQENIDAFGTRRGPIVSINREAPQLSGTKPALRQRLPGRMWEMWAVGGWAANLFGTSLLDAIQGHWIFTNSQAGRDPASISPSRRGVDSRIYESDHLLGER